MNSHVEDSETIARFIFSSSEYKVSNQTVKYTAFLPARDMAASVYRIDGCSEDEISQIDLNEQWPCIPCKASEEDRFSEAAAIPNSHNLTERGIIF